MTTSQDALVLSRPSPSPLTKVYQSPEFRIEWDNDVAFHVARNVVRLRRLRKMSQTRVANEMRTSQSAVARIESAQENITLSTLQRLIVALKGRLQISISPEEMQLPQLSQWWEMADTKNASSTTQWDVKAVLYKQTAETEQLVVGLERLSEGTPSKLLLEEGAH
jgi:transcriptional regulator with XRE-family HTH domain